MGMFLRDIMKQNTNFRLFGPDETASNRLSAVFEATGRAWIAWLSPIGEMGTPAGTPGVDGSGRPCPSRDPPASRSDTRTVDGALARMQSGVADQGTAILGEGDMT